MQLSTAPRRLMPAPVLPRPYPDEHLAKLTPAQWRTRPAVRVAITDVIPAQEQVFLQHLARLANGGLPASGDPAAQAVVFDAGLWLHNGAHRYVIAWLRGDPDFLVRPVDVYGNPVPWPAA